MTPTFLREAPKSAAGKARAWYICECGIGFVAQVDNVLSGNTRSCGCLRRAMHTTHGQSGVPLYHAWENMRQRCTNRDAYPTYKNVGCDSRWVTYVGFVANPPTTGRPFEPGLCLARFNDLGDYAPENTRWLTRVENCKEQAHGRPR